jgi:hypothetical protein
MSNACRLGLIRVIGGEVQWVDFSKYSALGFLIVNVSCTPEVYAKGSLLAAAKDLHGVPLLIRGVIDENVHAQNTLKLSYELQRAGKPFRPMMYEKSRHGLADPAVVKHMRQMMSISRWRC